MILWINGPYGVGKSSLAEELRKKIEHSFIFDAERIGDAVRENYPQEFFKETFEEFPLWHEMCYRLLKDLSMVYSGCVLVPMTLKFPESNMSIIQRLRDAGVKITHIILESGYDTIRERILSRGEDEDCWCIQQIQKCIDSQKSFPCDYRVVSDGVNVESLAEKVIYEVL